MNKPVKLTVRRRTAGRVIRTAEELADLQAARNRFQREKPTLEQVLAATGQTEAMPLGEYLHIQELLHTLHLEQKRQRVSLTELAERTGYDLATLSGLFNGRQANATLATMGRIANALGKEVVLSLRSSPAKTQRTAGRKQ